MFRSLVEALIAGLPPHLGFAAVQQLWHQSQFAYMGRGGEQTLRQPPYHFHADVQLQAEITFFALARQAHIKVLGLLLILG